MIQIQTGKMAMAKKNIVVLDQKEKKAVVMVVAIQIILTSGRRNTKSWKKLWKV